MLQPSDTPKQKITNCQIIDACERAARAKQYIMPINTVDEKMPLDDVKELFLGTFWPFVNKNLKYHEFFANLNRNRLKNHDN